MIFPLAFVACLLFSAVAVAQSGSSGKYEAQAALLLNFAKFVEWPGSSFDNPQAPIVFGIMGGEQLAFDLQRIAAGEKVQGRSLVVRKESFSDDASHCHVLFVSASQRPHIAQILAGLQAASVLTVSDIDGFADAGGIVQIATDGNLARFVVNLDAAKQSNLRLSAKLLALAHVISHGQDVR